MHADDRKALAKLLADLGGLYGREVTADVAALYVAALEPYTIAEIRAALSAHVRDPDAGRFMPRPADVIGKIVGADGRPSAEEAWALVPTSERAATVWTDETAIAAGAAMPLIAAGDVAGARMAFREAYDRAVAQARAQLKPVRWWLSRGHDRADDERALVAAVAAGRLSASRALQFAPTLQLPASVPDRPQLTH